MAVAGSITVTTSDLGGGVTKYSIAWVSSALGAVSGTSLNLKRGSLLRAAFIPDSAGTQPSDQYDVTLPDANGIDALQGAGADLSNSTAAAFELETVVLAGAFTPTIANAGNAKGGTIELVIGPAGAAAIQAQPLPVGAATASKQDTGNVSLASIDTKLGGYSFTNITTATTTVVKSGAGVLHGITINTKGTVASTVTIYDNTAGSGTKIGIIDSLNLSGPFLFDAIFATGLTIVTTGTAAPDITVTYR